MTDILSWLAAFTAKDDEVLKKPCPFCGSICGSAGHGEDFFWRHCDSCGSEGPEESRHPKDTDPDWNTRPREAALIALVQEAAGEIGRLRCDLVRYAERFQDSERYID